MFTRRHSVIALAILLALSANAGAQTAASKPVPEEFTAKTANLPARAGQSVSLEVLRWSTDEERTAALAVIKKGGAAEAFSTALSGLPTVGYLWAGTPLGYALKYAQRITDPSGTERIILVTDRPFGTWEMPSVEAAGAPAAAPEAGAGAAAGGGRGAGRGAAAGAAAATPAAPAPAAEPDAAAAPAPGAGRGAGGGRAGGRGAAAGAATPAADADPAAAPAPAGRGAGPAAAAGGGRGGARAGGRGGAPGAAAAASVPVEKVLTVIELRLPSKGPGSGKMSLNAKVAMDDQAKTIGIADYDSVATVLTNVVSAPKPYSTTTSR